MELQTPIDILCRLMIRARELEAQVTAKDPDDDPENVDDLDDDGTGEALSSLEDELNTSVEEEIIALLDDLADDQIAETLALAWIGRGTYDSTEWEDALAEANELSNDDQIDELLEMPLLASHLESGLAAFDYSCEGVGQLE